MPWLADRTATLMAPACCVLSCVSVVSHCPAAYKEGGTTAFLRWKDAAAASVQADIVICTSLGRYRNGIVGCSYTVVAVEGGACTLQVRQMLQGAVRLSSNPTTRAATSLADDM